MPIRDENAGPSVFLNGRMLPAEEARIDVRDRGFLLGDGVFETLAARAGLVVERDAHLRRLHRGGAVLGIPVPEDTDRLYDAMEALLDANGLREGAAMLRITLSRGAGGRGVLPPPEARPTLLIAAAVAPPPDAAPARVTLSAVARNRRSATVSIKCLHYADHIVARMRADALGCDEALMPNDAGRLACATAGNLFAVIDGVVVTPPVDEGILPGITRARVLALAAELGIATDERPLDATELGRADALFLTNSLIGIRPVSSVIDEAPPHQELFRNRDSVIVEQLAEALHSLE